jgi:hypothetical protein
MSQHIFDTQLGDIPIQIMLGWDRRLSYYFMVIEKRSVKQDSGEGEDEEIIYSNLNEPEPFKISINFYKAVLDRLGVQVPSQIWHQVFLDQVANAGNRFVIWQPDGSFKEK